MSTTKKEKETQGQEGSSNENQKMEIEITKYKGIINAFNNPRTLAKLIIVTSLLILIVFIGITGVALVLKSYYPYKTVNSNEYGATIIQNEDNEVIYWLFNSADLWANSGIHVKKGDIISVKSSGAFHTAIHHLVEDAGLNNKLRDKWMQPNGGILPNPKDTARSKFRISPNNDWNTILMQVIPDDKIIKPNNIFTTDTSTQHFIDGQEFDKIIASSVRNTKKPILHKRREDPDIYAIGAGRDKITIRTDGTLHFAVNDIALTKNILEKMIKNDDEIGNKNKLDLGKSPVNPNQTELHYYKDSNFVDAWFVDNVGSFLIVIERKRK